ARARSSEGKSRASPQHRGVENHSRAHACIQTDVLRVRIVEVFYKDVCTSCQMDSWWFMGITIRTGGIMLSRSALRLRACAIAAVVLVAVAAVSTDQNLPARYTALAVNLGDTPVRWKTKTVEIVVKRWSPEATRDRLLSILIDKGPEKLLDE